MLINQLYADTISKLLLLTRIKSILKKKSYISIDIQDLTFTDMSTEDFIQKTNEFF